MLFRHAVLLICFLLAPLFGQAEAAADEPLWIELSAEERATPVTGTVEAETFAVLAERLSPAVVLISITVPQQRGVTIVGRKSEYLEGGTGFVIRPDGYILTNNHVVMKSEGIRVTTVDNEVYDATLVGAYAQADLALLKIEAEKPLVAAPLGDSDELRIAEWVLAIGSPYGLNNTVTAGIVSAKGRKGILPKETGVHADFIQTDASINLGNSGGPLINMRGEVIGITSLTYQAAQGIGFAIPVNMAKKLLPQLAKGHVEQSYLGVKPQDLSAGDAQALGLADARGALVAQVVPGSPAKEAGLRVGDVIIRFGNEEVSDSSDLRWLAAIAGAGSTTTVEVLREEQRKVLSVTMTSQPRHGIPQPRSQGKAEGLKIAALGMHVAGLSRAERKAAGLPAKRGIKITSVVAHGPAAIAGLLPGDLILRFGFARVNTPKSLARMVSSAVKSKPILLHIQRAKSEAWVNLRKQ
jgi:serine protease Do